MSDGPHNTSTTPPQPPQPPPPPVPVQPQPQPPMQVMSYATLQPSNHAAVLSLVFGLLCFVPLFAPGILAVVLGRRGVKAAKEDAAGRIGLARAGIVLGVLNLVLSLAFFAVFPFALIQARQQALTVACASNLRQLGQATMIYAAQNKGFFPPTVDHVAAIIPGAAPGMFTCPACGTNPAKPPVVVGTTVRSHYFFVPPAAKLNQVKQPAKAVLAYEPPTHHGHGGMNLLFCDGHVEVVPAPLTAKITAELAAGQNPPPSKP